MTSSVTVSLLISYGFGTLQSPLAPLETDIQGIVESTTLESVPPVILKNPSLKIVCFERGGDWGVGEQTAINKLGLA